MLNAALQSRRGLFWPLVALGSLLEALAAASFATAVFSDPLPRSDSGWTNYVPLASGEVFGRTTTLGWTTDQGMLVAALLFAALGLAAYVLAARLR